MSPTTAAISFHNARHRFASRVAMAVAALLPFALLAAAVPVQGQDTRIATSVQRLPPLTDNLLRHLQTLRYDTTQYVPLLVVNPAEQFVPDAPLPDTFISLETLAAASHLRVVATGRLNTLVPPVMEQINNKPGKANIFARLSRSELVKLLAVSLTPAQWQTIGSAEGIGADDLDSNQRLLWTCLLPPHLDIEKYGTTSSTGQTTDNENIPVGNTSAVRLRINKKVNFSFSTAGTDAYNYGGGPLGSNDPADLPRFHTNIYNLPDTPANSIYGVVLLSDVRSAEKPSDVGYASPSLDSPIDLHFAPKTIEASAQPRDADTADAATLPTVGDLIERINAATHLTFVADRRVRDLPVYLRGDSARAGDVLRALARGICGTFRAIPASTPGESTWYLLTCDREGIGTQVGHLAIWADKARNAAIDIQEKASGYRTTQNPFADLSFSPDDRFALAKEQVDRLEAGWSQGTNTVEMKWDDLSPALQEGALHYQKVVKDSKGPNLRIDRIQVGEEMTTSLIVPGVGAIESDIFSQTIQSGISRPLPDKSRGSTATVQPTAPRDAPPFVWPSKLARRVLVAAPTTVDAVSALVQAAHVHGFTDLYLQVSLADPTASVKLLEAGVRAGVTAHVAVGATVKLLREGGLTGEYDRNILGETGAEYAAREIEQNRSLYAGSGDYYERKMNRYVGWLSPPDTDVLLKRLMPIIAVPGLTTLTFRDTTGSGWLGDGQYNANDYLDTNGRLGYGIRTRRAFIAAYGIDPIDIPEQHFSLNIPWTLGFFREDDGQGMYRVVAGQGVIPRPAWEIPRQAWAVFRADISRKMLADLYTALHTANPALSFALDDRLNPTWDWLSWFCRWDAADRLPEDPISHPHVERDAAGHSISGGTIAVWDSRSLRGVGADGDTPAFFAWRMAEAVNAERSLEWSNVAIDLTALPVKDVLRLLGGLPEINVGATH